MSVEVLQQIRAFPSLPPPARSQLLESIRSSNDPHLICELARIQHNCAFDLCRVPGIGRHPLVCFALLARVSSKSEALIVVHMLLQIVMHLKCYVCLIDEFVFLRKRSGR